MADFDTVIRGGTVVTAADVFEADVGIIGETVAAVGRNLGKGTREIDATGLLVMPGGVDSHCHIEQPGGTGIPNSEPFDTGTRSAACGGTTSLVCFSPQQKGTPIDQSLTSYHARAEKAVIDYTFHLIINDPTPETLALLPGLIDKGYRSIKVFMTYPNNKVGDEGLIQIMAVARRKGALMVIHAEHNEMIEWMTAQLIAAGLTEAKHHAWSKPTVVEREAVHRVCAMAEMLDQPTQIFHVTCADAAEEVHRAQQRGLKIWGETCTQYLVLTADDMDRPNGEGAKFVCSPAPRTKADQEALWGYLKTGVLDIVTSDHAPYDFGGDKGKLPDGPTTPFNRMPNGVPGLEARLPILFSEGVSKGRIDLPTFVALGSTNAAKLFGLHPKKGTIAPGSDADIAIWDPKKQVTITQDLMHHNVDYTPYEGLEVTGWPVITLSRGDVLWQNGSFQAEAGRGRFMPRGPYDYIKPLGRFTTPLNPFA